MYLGKYFDQLPHFYAVLEAHDTPDSLTAFLRETGADNIALDGRSCDFARLAEPDFQTSIWQTASIRPSESTVPPYLQPLSDGLPPPDQTICKTSASPKKTASLLPSNPFSCRR